ncbi:MAG: hypothetical protein JXB47_14025 [Anaerolineae bacterium]|nr:hypothetical protein [Anaerolineae bacterium]
MNTNAALRRLAWTVLALALLVAPAWAGAQAQEEENVIEAGQTVTGAIDDDNYFDLWRYRSPGGEAVTVRVESTGGGLDPSLAVVASQLDAVGISDDIDAKGGNYNSAVVDLTLPGADTVLIFVSRFGAEQGTSSGAYALKLTTRPVLEAAGTPGGALLALDRARIDAGPEDAWNHLMNLDVIPDWHGSKGIDIPTGAVLEGARGTGGSFMFLPVGQGYTAADVVIHSAIVWRGSGATQACGLVLRKQDSNNDAYGVYLGRAGWLDFGFIPQGKGENWVSIVSWSVPGLDDSEGGQNDLLVTAVGDTFKFFVNYEQVGAVTDSRATGEGAFFVSTLKDSGSQVRCEFNNYWVISLYP